VFAVVGVAVLVVCWVKVSGKTTLRAQQGWAIGSLIGVTIVCLAAGAWLLAGLREVRLGRRQLLIDIVAVIGQPTAVTAAGARRGAVAAVLVSGPNMTLMHRPDCPIVRGKPVAVVSPAEIEARSPGRCGMCAG